MTPPANSGVWWTRPRIVLPLLLSVTTLSALFAPSRDGPRSGDSRLTTHSTGSLGAGLLFELAERLGWESLRRDTPTLNADAGTIHALLDPSVPIRASEAHVILEHVRAGGGALLVLGSTTRPLLDSLRLRIRPGGSEMISIEADSSHCAERELPYAISLWFGGQPQMLSLVWRARAPDTVVHFIQAHPAFGHVAADTLLPTMVGFPLGAGRIVVVADADVFRNDAMRDCNTGLDVAAVRALEYLRDGGSVPRTRIVFDEYHHAFGARPGTISAVLYYLRNSPSGRLLAQLSLAGLLLLAALGPRIVAPRDERRVERRSPLEQVDALARAYAQVGATRTVAQRLLRAVRRRVVRGVLATSGSRERALDDEAWLSLVASKHPSLADDIAHIKRATSEALSARELATLGPALHRLETTLTRPT